MVTSHLNKLGEAIPALIEKVTSYNIYLLLKKTSVFAGLDETKINKLALMAKPRYYKKGQFIIMEGDVINYYHVILKGTVAAIKQNPIGKNIIVRILHPADTIGDVAITDREPISISAVAREDTVSLTFDREDFLSFILENPVVAINMIVTIGKRLKATQDRFMEMVVFQVEQRVINVLTELFTQFGVTVTLTHQEVADMSGTTRATCTRIIEHLEMVGIIRSLRRRILLTNMANLKRLSEIDSIISLSNGKS